MTYEMVSKIPLLPAIQKAFLGFATDISRLDHRGQFIHSGDGVVRVLKAIHVSDEKLAPGEAYPYPWKNDRSGISHDPFIAFEDVAGQMFALQNCVAALGYKHVYGLLIARNAESWILHATSDSFTAGSIDYSLDCQPHSVVRITGGQDEGCLAQVGSILEKDGAFEGEMIFTHEEHPVLIGVPWLSDCVNTATITAAMALIRLKQHDELPEPA